jgi:hypothetical protein
MGYNGSNFKSYRHNILYRKVVKSLINTNKLLGVFAENRKTKQDVAKILGMSPKTLGLRLKSGVFGSDEIEKLIDAFNIEDPMSIFFTQE